MKQIENETKKKQNCRHFPFKVKWSEMEAIFVRFDAKKCLKMKWSEKNKKEAKTWKQKRIKWNSGIICKETKKNIKVCLSVFQVYTKWSEKKQKKCLFHLASK